jgi:hypothetical protein
MTPPFDPVSGGIRVMWGLYAHLLTKGQVAYLNSTSDDRDNFVAIYPEIYQGNEAGASTVVRYLLNKPGRMALYGTPGPTAFAPTDRIYTFSKMYYDCDDEHTLFLPILDLTTFYDQKRKRTKSAYFVGKGRDLGRHPESAVSITREFATDQQQLADVLNQCQVLYSYDPVSAMTEIARLCGCRVVLCQEEYTEEQYKLYEPGMNGMGFNKDVKLDSGEFRTTYKALRRTFDTRLDQFILSTQK